MAVENDLVLIYFEEKPLVFARVEAISADYKPEWYQVTLLLLQVPLQVVTWILREAYINGASFTMDGKNIRLEKVVCPELPAQPQAQTKPPSGKKPGTSAAKAAAKAGQVIALADLKKKQDG